MKISYNWLQNYFEKELPKPEELSDGLTFHSFEVEEIEKAGNDTILNIDILPNRAHDCLSHRGVAKEVSAVFDRKIQYKSCRTFEPKETKLEIEIQSPSCFRYMGRIIKNVKVGESPAWLKEKLNVIGQKSINNIVDAANFVMYDLGQPIHSFDLDKMTSSKEQVVSIKVRNANKGEKITTLDGKEIELDESILIIADAKDPLAIAGVKGGTKAEVDMNTKNIVIEVANFEATSTRKTTRKTNIFTDASKRYENELSPKLCERAMNEITDLIHDIANGDVEDIVDVYPNPVLQRIVAVSPEYINKRLGSDFSKKEIESVWDKLNFEYRERGGEYEIRIPFLRLDLQEDYDLVEEVIRILGYDRLVGKLPEIKLDSSINETFYKMLWARNKLLLEGYSEVMTYTFTHKGEVEVLASASDKNFLRTNLSDGLKESIKLNQLNIPLLDIEEVKVFEIGTVFLKGKEEMHVAYGDKKNIIEISLDKYFDSFENKIIPGPHSKNTDDFLLKILATPKEDIEEKAFKPWSNYPFIVRDIAVWVPEEIKPENLVQIYKQFGTELLVKEPKLFDSFTKDNKTSFAYRLVFQSYDRTLTDKEINPIMEKITEKIISLGWQVR
jgi:phenylalanyl-tRNA synthetase beta chain